MPPPMFAVSILFKATFNFLEETDGVRAKRWSHKKHEHHHVEDESEHRRSQAKVERGCVAMAPWRLGLQVGGRFDERVRLEP